MTSGSVSLDDYLQIERAVRHLREENIRLTKNNEVLHATLEESRLAIRSLVEDNEKLKANQIPEGYVAVPRYWRSKHDE